MKILIIDDSEVYRDSIILLLKSEWPDAHIIEAEDGVKGIDQAVNLSPDLILIDGSMPQMNGDEAAAKLRSLPQTKHIPIIALTSEIPGTPIWQGLKNQCSHILSKPFDIPSFIELVTEETSYLNE